MQFAEGYVLKDRSLICLDCQSIFASRVLADLPPVTVLDKVEADLHRVLPHPGLRAALVAVCPSCGYADWASRFRVSIINPVMVPPSPDLPHARKFAMAVKHARLKGINPLDIAYIALNGLYCAREAGENDESWLELCAFEQSRGLDPEEIVVETGSDHLTMAELWRQLGSFDSALDEYSKAGMDGTIPPELIRQQITLAKAGDRSPTILSPYLVRQVFPEAAELSTSSPIEQAQQAQIIIEGANPLARLLMDESGKLAAPAEARSKNNELSSFKLDLMLETDDGQVLTVAVDELPQPPEMEQEFEPLVAVEPLVQSEPQVAVERQVQPEPQVAVEPQVPAQTPLSPPAIEGGVSVARVKQNIAVPHAGSSVNLVQANGDGSSVSIAISPATIQKIVDIDSAKSRQKSEAFEGASDPAREKEEKDPTHRALKRALRKTKDKENSAANFPKVQICDEDSGYAYTDLHKAVGGQQEEDDYDDDYAYDDAPASPQAQPAAASAQSAGNPQDAIAQVESFLSLTRQPSYQNWIRGYRR
jgi:hypothetical protein